MPVPATSTTLSLYPLQYGISRNGPQLADSQQVADLFTSTSSSSDHDSGSNTPTQLQLRATDNDGSTNRRIGDSLYQPVDNTSTSGLDESEDEMQRLQQIFLRGTEEQNFSDPENWFNFIDRHSGLSRQSNLQALADTSLEDSSNQQAGASSELSSSNAATSEESSRELESDTDAIPSPPNRPQIPLLRKTISKVFYKVLFMLSLQYPECNYISNSKTQKYKIPSQLQGRVQSHKTGGFMIYYDADENFLCTIKPGRLSSDMEDPRPDYVPTMGYLNRGYVNRVTLMRRFLFISFFVYLLIAFVVVLVSPFIITKVKNYIVMSLISLPFFLTVIAPDMYYGYQLFFSLSNKAEVILWWILHSPIIVYKPHNTREAFQRVGFFLETSLVDVPGNKNQKGWRDYIVDKLGLKKYWPSVNANEIFGSSSAKWIKKPLKNP